MTFSLTFGWWVAPLLVSVIAFGWHFWMNRGPSSGGYAAIGDAIVSTMTFFAALTVSLFAWLIWALCR